MSRIPIQATIVGYSGKACTLFSVYEPDSQILTIAVESAFRRDRRDDCMVITNNPDIERDGLFTEDDLSDAIGAFFQMQGGVAIDGNSTRLQFLDKAQRANPGSKIEKDGIDASGQKYRIAEDIACAQVAALATCWYANSRAGAVQNVLSMADSLNDLERILKGGILTI
jgi:hypothetical protein